ncbi:MAG TPA: Ig-like domain-containing protein [Anaerolineae bacterium]|nr:Ig-like domain-containing protein [Anaerolineae bacterium]
MKQSVQNSFWLTLFMLWLVAGAALFFMFTQRSTLQTRLGEAEATAEAIGGRATAVNILLVDEQVTRQHIEATQVAGAEILATQTTELATRTAQRDQLQTDLSYAFEDLAAERSKPPQIFILEPTAGSTYTIGTVVTLTAVIADDQGLSDVHVYINNVAVPVPAPSQETFYTYPIQTSWEVNTAGAQTVVISATNQLGIVSEPLIFTVLAEVNIAAANSELRTAAELAVANIRGLARPETVLINPVTPGTWERFLTGNIPPETQTAADRKLASWQAWGTLTESYDLATIEQSFLRDHIGGYYDANSQQLTVVRRDELLTLQQQAAYVREYMSLLQDLNYGLGDLMANRGNRDAELALDALASGDAAIVRQLYLYTHYLNETQTNGILGLIGDDETNWSRVTTTATTQLLTTGQDKLNEVTGLLDRIPVSERDDVPNVILAEAVFPYSEGERFIRYLFDQTGDFSLIEQAWLNPPQSTEQILHPERYLNNDVPVNVSLPPLTATLGTGWRLVEENVMGEFMWRQYLSGLNAPEQVNTATTGWGGDRFAVYQQSSTGDQLVWAEIIWDTDEDRLEFDTAFAEHTAQLWPAATVIDDENGQCWQDDIIICLYQMESNRSLVIRTTATTLIDTALAAELP